MTSTDLEMYEPPAATALIPAGSPDEFLKQAGRAAQALVGVVRKRKLSKRIGGRDHIQVEAWTTLGGLLGSLPGGKSVFAVADSEPEFVEIDGVKGFRAHVKAVTIDGETVGAAWALCMRDEPNWKGRPLHALAAMAETRATSRALRKPLGFIVELAGYSATAAEEMPPAADVIDDAELVVDPDGAVFPDERVPPPGQFTPPPGATNPDGPTQKQLGMMKRLVKKIVASGDATEDTLRNELELQYGTRHFSELLKGDASKVIEGLMRRAGETP